MSSKNGTMLLVVPVPFLIKDGIVMMEEQAHNGLTRWLADFNHVIVAAPTIPERIATSGAATIIWRDVSDLVARKSVTLLPLPWAYSITGFLKSYQKTRRLLAEYIDRVRYLQFAIGWLVGDWAAVAALEAIRQRRRFAIHTDRVEHKVLLEVSKRRGVWRRVKAHVIAELMSTYHRHLIQRCSLGLWHGSDCYHEYAPWCKTSYTIHDVHTKPEDCIGEESLSAKLEALESEETINICYAGRLDSMKAPLEWLKAVAVARDHSVPVKAAWLGDGPLRDEAQREIERLNLSDSVTLPGFVSDRHVLLKSLRTANILLFTHVTPESPRCLLESLISGTPIVGYRNKFAEELTSPLGGGRFVEIHDWEALGNLIATLASDRAELRQLTIDAARNGQRFSDVKVFAERSELILRFC